MNIDDLNLPIDVRSHLKETFNERGISFDDPIGNIVIAQVTMFEMQEKRRRGALLIFWIAGLILAFGGYFFGRWNEAQEALKARPMITVSNAGSSLVYGTQGGQRVIKVVSGTDKIKGAWVYAGEAYILVQ